ncbi:uncharacterized protein DDB_G0283697 [Aplysia californica]|uniref:Uncharacterized protein DDB_G0283697 n=1 Tax=Aplysia californica TaxID=6500 RepID=A0ABM0JNN2_APLCA|nr:uncharacterized protein DDB_G0283697 [Aplysia californica]
MAFNNKNKSRIPVPKEDAHHQDTEEVEVQDPVQSHLKTGNHAAVGKPAKDVSKKQKKTQQRSNPVPQPSSHHPLAKAMQKRPPVTEVNQSSETYADEKIESVSQKLRGQSKADYLKRKEEMERQLHEAEAQLGTMTDLLEQREKLLQEAQEDAENKTSALQERITDQEEKLILNGIDPVTGEKTVIAEEDKEKMESTKKFTKKRIQKMREKLRQMSAQTETYLVDIENTVHYLESLEDASERAGPISEETQKLVDDAGSDEFIAKVYAENVPPPTKPAKDPARPNDAERESPSGRESPQDDDDGDDDEKEEGSQAENLDSKFFITSREGEAGDTEVLQSNLTTDVQQEDS